MKALSSIETTDGDILAVLSWLDNSIEHMCAFEYDDSDFAAPIERQKAAVMEDEERFGRAADALYALVSC